MDAKFKPISRLSFRDEVYRNLKKAIMLLELAPGQRLNDKELAEHFGISRTPVREALKRLEDEGLVESVPNSATRVTPLMPEEAKHAFTVVAALHALAARLAAPLLTEAGLEMLVEYNERLRSALERKDVVEAVEADDDFHQVLLESAANPEISMALTRIEPKIRRLEIARFSSVTGFRSVAQHEEIILACRNGDGARAAKLVEDNWLSLHELLTGPVSEVKPEL